MIKINILVIILIMLLITTILKLYGQSILF
jgi:hypothetical protein